MHALIAWQHPGTVVKWILGYLLGAYVAIPNFGLVAEPTIPDHALSRHRLVGNLPFIAYILTTVVLSYLLPVP
jgi:hypothetical protein